MKTAFITVIQNFTPYFEWRLCFHLTSSHDSMFVLLTTQRQKYEYAEL
jgi:hypothetical protein